MMATPTAAPTAPTNAPMPFGVAHVPLHCSLTKPKPMRPPHTPAIKIAPKASRRAASGGAPDGGPWELGGREALGSSIGHDATHGAVTIRYRDARISQEDPRILLPVRILVVLPTYNEAENVDEVLTRTRAALPDATVLVVDDGSPDGTADAAEAFNATLGNITVMRRVAKTGLGSAYRAGFAWGIANGFDVLIEMDADLSHDPAALPAMIAKLSSSGAGLVIGSRYIPGGEIPNWSWHRKALSKWGNRYAGAVLDMPVHDATSGFRAYRAEVIGRLDLDTIRADGYGFQIEMAYEVRRLGESVVEYPISFRDRVRGTSKMSGNIVVEAMRLVTWWAIRDRVLRRK